MFNKYKKQPTGSCNTIVWGFYSRQKIDLLKNFKQKYKNKLGFIRGQSGKQDEE